MMTTGSNAAVLTVPDGIDLTGPWPRTGCGLIDDYAGKVLSSKVLTSAVTKWCVRYHLRRVTEPGVTIDHAKINRAREIIERYFPFKLFDWELYLLALVHCFKGGDVLFRDFLIVMGTGNGKNGFISGLTWYFTTPDHGVKGYNIDVIANSEEQAMMSPDEIRGVLEENKDRLNRQFKWTKTSIDNVKTGSYIRYNTSNARTRAGKRSACLVFDEIFMFENYDVIREYQASFGKRPMSRIFKITSQGNVRDGVLDTELKTAHEVLLGNGDDLRSCPLIYGVEAEEEVLDPAMWVKANPSYDYLPSLQTAIKTDFAEMRYKSEVEETFYTKRMNWPRMSRELTVASHEELTAASREIELDLTGRDCVAGIDYALLSDMTSAGLLFRSGPERYWIQHSWICRESADWDRIRAPLLDWEDRGDLTIVDGPQIDPMLVVDWLAEQMQRYNVTALALDTARFALLREPLESIGFEYDRRDGNITLVRPLQIVSVSPVIESWFRTGAIRWGEIPLMRWAANNTKRVRMKAEGASGNYKYDKIEGRSRKTDPFMALVHAAVLDEELAEMDMSWINDLPAVVG